MRVALDAQLCVGTPTGIGEYVNGLYAALRGGGCDVVELCEPRLNPWRFDRRVLWDQVLLPRRAKAAKADLLHCASGTMPLLTTLPTVVTVHDVAWHHVQSHAPPYSRYYFGSFSLQRYRSAARIVVDSAYSRGALLELLDGVDASRVEVVYPGVAAAFAEIERAGDRRTILAVGTVEPRKNLALLIRALPHLAGARLVAVGPKTPYAQECAALAQRLGVADRLELRGYVDRAALLELYRTAATVAVPSLYEGFGYAAAQALCAGAPCIVSDRTSLPEIAGGDATVLPLSHEDAWVNALRGALQGDLDEQAAAARSRSVSRFSWEHAAEAIAATYGRVAL